jgi:hypothetical protein
MPASPEHERAKRDLRLRIGRLRRRIDGRVRSVRKEGGRLVSWQTYVRHYPAYAVLAAMALGLAVSGGLKGGLSRLVGRQLFRRAAGRAIDRIWGELEQIWEESSPERSQAQARGAEHGRS